MLSATALTGALPSFGYWTRPVHIKSIILPPPVSDVLAGTRPTSGWVPSMVIAPFAVSPLGSSVPLSSPPLQPAATSATATAIATTFARFETLMIRGLL
jgi:hypothetical protein